MIHHDPANNLELGKQKRQGKQKTKKGQTEMTTTRRRTTVSTGTKNRDNKNQGGK